ncbi:MAG: ThuA domain-containing protein [Planctomycetaceae bacterium]
MSPLKLNSVVLLFLLTAAGSYAQEGVPVTSGLKVHLSPERLSSPDTPAAAWPSVAEPAFEFRQPDPDRQPQVIAVAGTSILRFDGEDDVLRATSTGLSASSATVFLVAAVQSNPGEFRGLLAGNAPGRRDYESGMTIDLGPGPSRKLDQLNVEGSGFGGAKDLLNDAFDFGTLHTFEVTVNADSKLIRLLIDGTLQDSRPYQPGTLSLEELTLGARYYTNGPGDQQVRGPFRGDIAEVLIFDRILSDGESKSVRKHLQQKFAQLAEELPKTIVPDATAGIELVKADNPPPVQMLVPGFDVVELPVELTNCNNVRFRDDGKLVTLGYNGDIHLLTDTDGDGLEDTAEVFWKNSGSLRGPIGMLLTPPGYSRGRGVFVPSKGKVSLIVDTDGDDKADEEIVVASGWKEIAQNVDALAPAMDADGNLYFGLGVADFANAYQVKEDGKARYDINADNGTIQKVSPDFKTREAVCTGIRFPIAMAFNQHGDLFCTEQEGATWLANGNPLDELLHIRLNEPQDATPNPIGKRHFGFPPRHPEYNPKVIDEPSTFDFGPQHQSTCGMVFNESVNGGPVFGPEWWQHDAIICGESRGKLWRTRTVKTQVGYVADSQLIACLQLLTVDACVGPDGSLTVACHSGPPDWGTGPTGIGKLFRIRHVQPDAPRPVTVSAAGPQEIQITFDRPLDPVSLKGIADRIEIQYGEHVRAADRFENLVPPYAVVRAQQLRPRFRLPVTGTTLTADQHTILIQTAPMTADVHYAVKMPLAQALNQRPSAERSGQQLFQHPQLDVDFALRGIQAVWTPDEDQKAPKSLPSTEDLSWQTTIPHLDTDVCESLRTGLPPAEFQKASLEQPGNLHLETQLDLRDMLRPAIQPGATIDYAWPDEIVTVTISSQRAFTAAASVSGDRTEDLPVTMASEDGEPFMAAFTTPANVRELVKLTIDVRTGGKASGQESPELTIHWHTNEDPQARPFPLRRFVLPWVRSGKENSPEVPSNASLAELQGGSWGRGRQVFRSEAAGCFKCHQVGGNAQPGIGPDLKNLIHRDYASVVRDIRDPGFAINPDYIGHVIQLKDGRVLTGVLQSQNGHLLVGDANGRTTVIEQDDIEALQPAKTSVMPRGLSDKLTPQQWTDLLTYLLVPPPQMPLDSPLTAPPLRTQAEVATALEGSVSLPETLRPLKLVLVAGPKDHGPGEHDYPAWQQAWRELLAAADGVSVETAWEFPNEDQLATADVLLFFQKGSFGDKRPGKLDAFLQRGGGAVYLHWAVNGNDQVKQFADRIGLASWGGKISYRHGPLTLDIQNTDHPIVRNFDRLQLYDESYWKLTGDPGDSTVLATSTEDGQPTPQLWVRDHRPGRVFVSIPGHYNWTFDDPLFRILLLRGIAWTAQEPIDRFNDLVPLGARMMR